MRQLIAQEAALGQAGAFAETHGVYLGSQGKPGQFHDVSACPQPPDSVRKVTVVTASLVTFPLSGCPSGGGGRGCCAAQSQWPLLISSLAAKNHRLIVAVDEETEMKEEPPVVAPVQHDEARAGH